MPPRNQQDRFVALIDEHRKILFKIAGAYAHNPADREDLIQEMVLQMWQSFDRYDETRRFSTWMYRVALNVAISFYRGQTRRSRVIVNDESVIALAATPGGQETYEELATLWRMIEGLNEFDRALVILYLDGNSYGEIATVLGISESNVGTKLNRIKQQLREQYADKEKHDGTR
ncbi:MAG TPA: sigma-70 family RNA polymerase sigma factor [Candidatus Krumholzibacteria bacterium]|nr:sigma-70 family RNA polymerase sigma factor [Candidatus Krumholzibacteria bacterium]